MERQRNHLLDPWVKYTAGTGHDTELPMQGKLSKPDNSYNSARKKRRPWSKITLSGRGTGSAASFPKQKGIDATLRLRVGSLPCVPPGNLGPVG